MTVLFIFVNPATNSPAATAKAIFTLLTVLAIAIRKMILDPVSLRLRPFCSLYLPRDFGLNRLALSCTLLC